MKIGIITDNMDKASAGVGSYTKSLIEAILKIDKENKYTFIHNRPLEFYKDKKDIIIKDMENTYFYGFRKFILFPLTLRKKKFHIMHDTYHFFPLLFDRKIKRVISIMDLTALLYKDKHRFKSFLAHQIFLKWTLKRVDKIITISENTKKDLIKHLKIPNKKIKVIPLAANPIYKKLPKNKIQKFKKEKSINYPYLLYVGTIEPRKNIPLLLKAFYLLKKDLNLKHKLVIVGKKGWKYEDVFTTIKKLNLEKDIIFTGYIDYEEIPYWYNSADVLVYPSFYEGFGLPPLEAMACGCPVITSNTSSLPEVVGNAGLMINPNNLNELAIAIKSVLTNKKLKNNLIKKGLKQAKKFSWEKTAKQTLEVYNQLHNKNA